MCAKTGRGVRAGMSGDYCNGRVFAENITESRRLVCVAVMPGLLSPHQQPCCVEEPRTWPCMLVLLLATLWSAACCQNQCQSGVATSNYKWSCAPRLGNRPCTGSLAAAVYTPKIPCWKLLLLGLTVRSFSSPTLSWKAYSASMSSAGE